MSSRLAAIATCAAALFAFRDLDWTRLANIAPYDVNRWIYVPAEKTPLAVLAVALWLLWRRRERWLCAPPERAWGLGGACLVVGIAFYLWSLGVQVPHLQLASLSACTFGFAALLRGRAGARVVSLPALIVLLGMPIPAPIQVDLVWQLQLWTANATALAMESLGQDVAHAGVVLRHGDQVSMVVESCSGLRGIEILILAGIATRELFAYGGPRQWWVVLAAPLIGFAFNVLRVWMVAVSDDPEVARDHTSYGVAVLFVGSLLLYLMSWALAENSGRVENNLDPDRAPMRTPLGAIAWAPAALFAVLGVAHALVPPFANASPVRDQREFDVPRAESGWVASDIEGDQEFTGLLDTKTSIHRRYDRQRPRQRRETVELFAHGARWGHAPPDHLLGERIAMPSAEWTVTEVEPIHSRSLDREVQLARLSSGEGRALSYSWRLHDNGWLSESLRNALALENSPLRRAQPPVVIRLSTVQTVAGPVAEDRARRSLEAFTRDFGPSLNALSGVPPAPRGS